MVCANFVILTGTCRGFWNEELGFKICLIICKTGVSSICFFATAICHHQFYIGDSWVTE